MYNIKLTDDTCRTVILTKNKVEIDGKDKTLIMIRDVSDKVRLQQEQVKKIKQKKRTFKIQSNLDEVFKQHREEIVSLCTLLSKDDTPSAVQKLAVEVKRSNCDLFLNFCQFNDLINLQNDTFYREMTEFKPK